MRVSGVIPTRMLLAPGRAAGHAGMRLAPGPSPAVGWLLVVGGGGDWTALGALAPAQGTDGGVGCVCTCLHVHTHMCAFTRYSCGYK